VPTNSPIRLRRILSGIRMPGPSSQIIPANGMVKNGILEVGKFGRKNNEWLWT